MFRIGVDCDGVLYHWDRTARYMLRRRLADSRRRIPPELHRPSTDWDMIQNVVEDQDWRWLWTEGVRLGLFRYGHVVGGSLEGLTALARLGDVIVVTSRLPGATKDTLAWLSLMTDKIELQGIYILSHGQPKSTVQPPLDVLVDDGLHNAEDMVQNTKTQVVLFNQPWNASRRIEDEYPDQVTRAYGWDDVVRIVGSLR